MAATKKEENDAAPLIIGLGIVALGAYAANKAGIFNGAGGADADAPGSVFGGEYYDGGYITPGTGSSGTTSQQGGLSSVLSGLFGSMFGNQNPNTIQPATYTNPSDEQADVLQSKAAPVVLSEAANAWGLLYDDWDIGNTVTYYNKDTGQQVAFAGQTAANIAKDSFNTGKMADAALFSEISATGLKGSGSNQTLAKAAGTYASNGTPTYSSAAEAKKAASEKTPTGNTYTYANSSGGYTTYKDSGAGNGTSSLEKYVTTSSGKTIKSPYYH